MTDHGIMKRPVSWTWLHPSMSYCHHHHAEGNTIGLAEIHPPTCAGPQMTPSLCPLAPLLLHFLSPVDGGCFPPPVQPASSPKRRSPHQWPFHCKLTLRRFHSISHISSDGGLLACPSTPSCHLTIITPKPWVPQWNFICEHWQTRLKCKRVYSFQLNLCASE